MSPRARPLVPGCNLSAPTPSPARLGARVWGLEQTEGGRQGSGEGTSWTWAPGLQTRHGGGQAPLGWQRLTPPGTKEGGSIGERDKCSLQETRAPGRPSCPPTLLPLMPSLRQPSVPSSLPSPRRPPHPPALDGGGGLRQQLPHPLPLCSTHRRPWCEGRRRGKAGYLFPNPSCPVTVSWSHPPTVPKHSSISQSSGQSCSPQPEGIGGHLAPSLTPAHSFTRNPFAKLSCLLNLNSLPLTPHRSSD